MFKSLPVMKPLFKTPSSGISCNSRIKSEMCRKKFLVIINAFALLSLMNFDLSLCR